MVKAILIDPFTRTVSDVELERGDRGCLDAMHRTIECDCICSGMRWANGNWLVVDDEGLLKGPTHFFRLAQREYNFAGRGLICGTDHQGETTDVIGSAADVREQVQFVVRETPLDESEIPPPQFISFATDEEFFAFLNSQGREEDAKWTKE